ncbi:unnamed protein product [Ceutorhynchus assimilis]|uniref:BZIP domain-containing protein n=1 Tax=Ceutorhynchus assimilis TaxID=467358 RepID=A0A9N9MHC7_9CUCU|nr:unnamed protein product [Ceutorhynchus assimilis]
MDSVQLMWKQEPVSPLNFEEASLLDDAFYQSSLFDDVKLENEHFENCESKAEVASLILENLEKLVDLDELIKSESSFLLDEKMLPLLDDMEPPHGAVAVPIKPEYYELPAEEPTYVFNDLENVYFELNHAVTLTPPQSPPAVVITTLEPGAPSAIVSSVPEKQQFQSSPTVLTFPPDNYASTPQPDIARELAVVDEIVRSTVEDMQWSSSGSSSPTSSSQSSNFGDYSSSSDDTEWIPESTDNGDASFNQKQTKKGRKRSSNKPYSPDDKKNRKKEQNKNAATRYRLKKKAEVEIILTEEKGLLDIHGELSNQITDLQREIKYLKGLMRDLFKAKGLIN